MHLGLGLDPGLGLGLNLGLGLGLGLDLGLSLGLGPDLCLGLDLDIDLDRRLGLDRGLNEYTQYKARSYESSYARDLPEGAEEEATKGPRQGSSPRETLLLR